MPLLSPVELPTRPQGPPHHPDVRLAPGLTADYLLHHRLCPVRWADDGALVVATAPDALLESAQDDLVCAYESPVRWESAPAADVERLILRLTAQEERAIELAHADSALDESTADVRDLVNQAPVIAFLNMVIRDASERSASDIHFEATRSGLVVRYRIDGSLSEAAVPPRELALAVLSRLKVLAELDIAERRRPQDGRIRVRLDARELDLRVSTVPTMFGESVVLRLLDRGGRPVELAELGMSTTVLGEVARVAARPHGMLLVTGPTGSGKTTTLYAALARRSAGTEKIITVEDPVEYQLAGVAQVPVHRQSGVTFASALRSILRQDPDVIMIGEMRDAETAEIAVQAAMTGHLVFSTLHTNDALGAIPRLRDLGVPPYLIAATVEAVLAQRLVRRICSACPVPYVPPPEQVAAVAGGSAVEQRVLVRGAGCQACGGTGYRGRLGLFELVRIDDAMREAILAGASRAALREHALRAGMRPMRLDGWDRIQAGLTTVEEVLRAVES